MFVVYGIVYQNDVLIVKGRHLNIRTVLVHQIPQFCRLLLIAFALFFITSCSLPENSQPARWNVSAVVPLAKESVLLWEELDSITSELNQGKGGSTSLLHDSILTILRQDTMTTTLDLGTFFETEPSQKSDRIGEIEITNMDFISVPLVQTISNSSQLSVTLPLASSQFETMHFTSNSAPIQMTVTNSSLASISGGSVILDSEGKKVVGTIAPTAPGANAVVTLDVAGLTITTNKTKLTFSVQYGSPIPTGVVGVAALTLNGAMIDQGVIQGALFPDSVTMPVSVDLAESLFVELVNYKSLEIISTISNGFSFPVNMKTALVATKTGIPVPLFTTAKPIKYGNEKISTLLSNVALTPRWIDSTQVSTLDVAVTIYPVTGSGMIDYDANDSLVLSIDFGKSTFQCVIGVLTNGLSDTVRTEEWELPELMAPDIRDSVIGKLQLLGSQISAKLLPDFSSLTHIDSVNFDLATGYHWVDNPVKKMTIHSEFTHLKGQTSALIQQSGDSVINSLPELLNTESVIAIPPNTGFAIVSTDGSVKLPFTVLADMLIPIHAVTTVAPVSLITSLQEIEVPSEDLQMLKSIDNPTVKLNLHYKNNSSVTMGLYGVGADRVNAEVLDTLNASMLVPSLSSNPAFSFFDLTGARFIELKSGEEVSETLTLASDALIAFADNDLLGMRFHVLLPAGSDMLLTNLSSIDIRSSIELNGIARSDFLEDSK